MSAILVDGADQQVPVGAVRLGGVVDIHGYRLPIGKDTGQLLRRIGLVKASAGGIDLGAVAVVDGKVAPSVFEIAGQLLIGSGAQGRVLQQPVPVRRLVDLVQSAVPQPEQSGRDQQQRQGKEQIAAHQQAEQAAPQALIFQSYTPVLSQ